MIPNIGNIYFIFTLDLALQWKYATEIPPMQQHEIKAPENFKTKAKNSKSEDILLKEYDAVLFILNYLNGKRKKENGQHDPSKYYSLKKILSKLKHIKNVESLIGLLIAVGDIEKSAIGDGIRISFKGSKHLINDKYLG